MPNSKGTSSGAITTSQADRSHFDSLPPPIQAQALRTLAQIWKSDPNGLAISLAQVSAAFLAAERLMEAISAGVLLEADLLALEAQIESVGGALSTGLRSRGEGSLAWCRALSFEALRSLLAPNVMAAVEPVLGLAVRRLQPADVPEALRDLVQVVSPLTAPPPGSTSRDTLLALPPDQQVAVFLSWRQALERGAGPNEASLEAALRVGHATSNTTTTLPVPLEEAEDQVQLSSPLAWLEGKPAAPLSGDFSVLKRYGLLQDVLSRRAVINLITAVSFDEKSRADVMAELFEDLGIPRPYPEQIDATWLNTLSPAKRQELQECWHDLLLRYWIEENYDEKVKEYFREREKDYQQYIYECVRVADKKLAHDLHRMIVHGLEGFEGLSARYSIGEERLTRGVTGPVYGSQLPDAIREALDTVNKDQVSPPIQNDNEYVIVRLMHRFPAQMNQAIREQLLWELFERDLQAVVDGQMALLESGSYDLAAVFEDSGLRALFAGAADANHPGQLPGVPVIPATPSPEVSMPRALVVMETDAGVITLKLFPKEAPECVANFLELVRQGFYDGLAFHRVIDGFMAQSGCPHTRPGAKGIPGMGGPGYTIHCAPNNRPHVAGSLSMVHVAPNQAGSQFFLCHASQAHLNGQHTVFGQTSDLTVMRALRVGSRILRMSIQTG